MEFGLEILDKVNAFANDRQAILASFNASYIYLNSSGANQFYLFLSLSSIYTTLVTNMKSRNQISSSYAMSVTFFIFTTVQITRSFMFSLDPFTILRNQRVLPLAIAFITVHHLFFYSLKRYRLVSFMEKFFTLFHTGNLFAYSYAMASSNGYPPLSVIIMTITSSNLSFYYLKLENNLYGHPLSLHLSLQTAIGQTFILACIRMFLEHRYSFESEVLYMIIQVMLILFWLVLPQGFWESFIDGFIIKFFPEIEIETSRASSEIVQPQKQDQSQAQKRAKKKQS